jgi:hypothetical protein
MVTQKLDFIPLNPLIPSNFSKKNPSVDLLRENYRKIKEKLCRMLNVDAKVSFR